jgi:hypothetical protein
MRPRTLLLGLAFLSAAVVLWYVAGSANHPNAVSALPTHDISAEPTQHTPATDAPAERQEPSPQQQKIAEAIGNGHSYQKHVVDERLFPEVKSRADFIQLIGRVVANPTHSKKLANDRKAYYDQSSNTIVIVNLHARDRGTCFRPRNGLRYYENLE